MKPFFLASSLAKSFSYKASAAQFLRSALDVDRDINDYAPDVVEFFVEHIRADRHADDQGCGAANQQFFSVHTPQRKPPRLGGLTGRGGWGRASDAKGFGPMSRIYQNLTASDKSMSHLEAMN